MLLTNSNRYVKKRLGDPQWIAYTLNNIALVYRKQNDYEEAISHVLQAYVILKRLKSPELQRSVNIMDDPKDGLGSL